MGDIAICGGWSKGVGIFLACVIMYLIETSEMKFYIGHGRVR